MRALRVVLELLGLAFAGAVGFACWFSLAYSGSAALAAFAGGYAVLALALWSSRRRGRSLGARAQLDCALAALVPAALLTSAAVSERWPIRGPRVDAHGWGLSGGEPNVLFLSWLHAVLWLALAAAWVRWERSNRA